MGTSLGKAGGEFSRNTGSERDRHRMGAHALARDAAGGVGGADEGRGDLTVALALPYRKAVEMDVVRLHSGHGLVARESDRELHLILGHGLVADDADDADPRTTPCPVGLSRRQLPTTDCVTSLLSEERFVRHVRSPRSSCRHLFKVRCHKARRPIASTRMPVGRQAVVDIFGRGLGRRRDDPIWLKTVASKAAAERAVKQ
jgi:hypothetical protein